MACLISAVIISYAFPGTSFCSRRPPRPAIVVALTVAPTEKRATGGQAEDGKRKEAGRTYEVIEEDEVEK